MTRKQLFEMVAKAMHSTKPRMADAQWRLDCIALADELMRHNPTFDRKRFYTDCIKGPNQEK